MDSLTETVFQELFATPKNRNCAFEVREVQFENNLPTGKPAIKIAHETILAQGYSKISATKEDHIDYSRIHSDGRIEYRTLRWDPAAKRIAPESISDPHFEDPFPSEIVEGIPIGLQS